VKNQIKLGRYFGVEIGLHVSWFIIAFLITLSLAQQFQARNPSWSVSTLWITALLTALLFFVTIVVHEMSHALVAARTASRCARSRFSPWGAWRRSRKRAPTRRPSFGSASWVP